MDILQMIASLLIAIAGGSAAAAVVNAMHDRWKFKATREAKKEDKAEEMLDMTDELKESFSELKNEEEKLSRKHDKDMKSLTDQMAAQSEALRLLLLDRILTMGEDLIEQKEVTFEKRKQFHAMHSCYHDRLNGNGDADIVVEGVDRLPLKIQQ